VHVHDVVPAAIVVDATAVLVRAEWSVDKASLVLVVVKVVVLGVACVHVRVRKEAADPVSLVLCHVLLLPVSSNNVCGGKPVGEGVGELYGSLFCHDSSFPSLLDLSRAPFRVMNVYDSIADLLSDGEEEAAAAEVCLAAVQAAVQAAASPLPAVSSLRAWSGRQAGSRRNSNRGPCRWYDDYLSPAPTYTAREFRARFRVPLGLYRVLEAELPLVEPKLMQRADCTGRPGHPLYVKILHSLRRLGNKSSFQDFDDQARMSVESQRQAFETVLLAVRTRFGPRYLNREPSPAELRSIEQGYAARGFPGCVGCVDCMKLKWKNCPREWKGQFHNPKDSKLAVLSCEAVCDSDLYCWHWFAGRPGTNNDRTVLDYSPLFNDILSGSRSMHLPGGYELNGVLRQWMAYFLGDGAYPRWPIFFPPDHAPTTQKKAHASHCQESVRKDVERLFGCLQGRFHILRRERFEWSDEVVLLIAQVCIILHNMIVVMGKSGALDEEAAAEGYEANVNLLEEFCDPAPAAANVDAGHGDDGDGEGGLEALLDRVDIVTSEAAHVALKDAVTDHLWSLHGAT